MSKTKAEIGGRLVGLVQSQTLSHSFLSLLPGGHFFFFFFLEGLGLHHVTHLLYSTTTGKTKAIIVKHSI